MENEVEAFEDFREKYRVMHPPPRRPNPARLDWKFWLVLLVVPAQILLAALRTASIFFKAAELGGSETLAYAEAVLAIMAVEVALVVYSAIKAARRNTISDWVMNFGIVLMVGISVFAGLSQSIHLIDGIDPQTLRYLQYGVSLMVGIGASVIAWIGGEILGAQVAVMGIRNAELMAEYDDEREEYNDRVIASWNASHERKIARAEIVEEVRSLPSVRSNRSVFNERQNEQNEQGAFFDRAFSTSKPRSSPKTEEVFAFLNEEFYKSNEVPGPREIERQLDVSLGTASKARNEWLKEMGLSDSL